MWNQHVELFGLGLDVTVNQLIVLTAFIGLVVGYLLAMAVNRRYRSHNGLESIADKERITSNASFMKGINYILSEKTDQAIEELTRAVAVDTDTVETYIALGNLFRSKGEIDRAIRIRQSIILRPKIDEKVRRQALFDLGLDYRRGGFYERAILTFEDIIRSDPGRLEAYEQLAQIYEEVRDWRKAFEHQEKLAKKTGRRANHILAHYQTELGKALVEQGRLPQARAAYRKALSLEPKCVDAYLHLGDLQFQEGKPKKALATWRKIIEVAPDMTFLTFGRLARLATELKDLEPVVAFLTECAAQDANPLAHLALARLMMQDGQNDRGIEELTQALKLDPDLFEARQELGQLLLAIGRNEEALEAYRDFLEYVAAPEATFQCGRCGFESAQLMWRCPQCAAWDSMTLHRHRPVLFGQARPIPPVQPVFSGEEEDKASEGE